MQEVCCSRLAIIVAVQLIGPEPLVWRAAAFGKAHAYARAVFGDELDPSLPERHAKGSGVHSRDRHRSILGFGLRDCLHIDPTTFGEVSGTPPNQGPGGPKLASCDRAEIIQMHDALPCAPHSYCVSLGVDKRDARSMPTTPSCPVAEGSERTGNEWSGRSVSGGKVEHDRGACNARSLRSRF